MFLQGVVVLAMAGALFHGRVFDHTMMHPLPHVTVVFCDGVRQPDRGYRCGKRRFRAVTDRLGFFAIDGLTDGWYLTQDASPDVPRDLGLWHYDPSSRIYRFAVCSRAFNGRCGPPMRAI